MKLIQYRGRVPNFGDDLNGVLWSALAPDLLDDDKSDAFFGIGTIVGLDCDPAMRLHVFSSGIGNEKVDKWQNRDVTYWCVRGPLSCKLLGLPTETAITDGAIVTPFATGFPKVGTPGSATLVIPHFQTLDFPGWDKVAAHTGFTLVDPRADPHSVIEQIATAKLVLTESLHGAILADTYGIPWRVFGTSGNFGATKFLDWCASLGIPFELTYVPPPNAEQILQLGKGPCVWGKTVCPSIDEMIAAFEGRVGAPKPPSLRGRVKAQLKQLKLLQPLLGYSPSRTAAALTDLAKAAPQLSGGSVRNRLQDRLMTRLDDIAAHARSARQSARVLPPLSS